MWIKYNCERTLRKFGFFPTKGMQTTPLPLRIAPIFMKDAHSAESNEKSIFRFLFFELWLIVFIIYGWHTWIFEFHRPKKIVQKWPHLQERCAMSWNEWKNGRFCTNNKKRIVLGGLHPPNPQFLTPPMHRGLWPRALDAFRLNLSSQLVLGYYWLAFLNQVPGSKMKCPVYC